jgi:DNA polymerase-1|tara:strand:- start:98 stop:838 length:741 start_codon:yes stop_codon:yes gene_type:complete
MKTALVDADMFIFKAAAAVQQAVNWADEGQPDLWQIFAKESDGIRVLDGLVKKAVKEAGCDNLIMCLSDREGNFRKDLNPDYKNNRKDTVKPMLIGPLEAYVKKEHYDHKIVPKLEADDVMGILQTSMRDTVIISGDKDMLTIAGNHYNHLTKEKRKVSKDEADYFFHKQILMGDRVDGYEGCQGIGPKKADKILEGVPMGERWAAVEEAFEKKEQDNALLMARMARILQVEDWDADKQEVILWTP